MGLSELNHVKPLTLNLGNKKHLLKKIEKKLHFKPHPPTQKKKTRPPTR